jgi:hypothetical protein
MLKNLVQIEAKVENWASEWNIPNDLPINVAKEMLFIFTKYIGQIEDAAKAKLQENKLQEENKSNIVQEDFKSDEMVV